jgi:hypothetical protein
MSTKKLSIEDAATLAEAVLVQAVRDARKGKEDAREWLSGPDAAFYLETLGYDPANRTAWIEGGCKNPLTQPKRGPRGGTSDSRNHRPGKYSRGDKPRKTSTKKVCF